MLLINEAAIDKKPISKDLLAVCLHGFGILEVHLWRGDIWEQFSYLQPKCKTGDQGEKFQRFERTLSFSHQFLDRM